MWEKAGFVGCVDPRPMKLWQVLTLFTGKDKATWQHTAALMAAVVNCQKGPKEKPVTPDQFNPYRRERVVQGMLVTSKNIGDAVTMLVPPEKQAEGRKEAERNKRKTDELRERLRQRRAAA